MSLRFVLVDIFLDIVLYSLTLQREKKKPEIGKEYFHHKNLEEIVKSYPYKINLPEDDVVRGKVRLLCCLKFAGIITGLSSMVTVFFLFSMNYHRNSNPVSSN